MNATDRDTLRRCSVSVRFTSTMRPSTSQTFSNLQTFRARTFAYSPIIDALVALGRIAERFDFYSTARAALEKGRSLEYADQLKRERDAMTPADRRRHDATAAAYHGGEDSGL